MKIEDIDGLKSLLTGDYSDATEALLDGKVIYKGIKTNHLKYRDSKSGVQYNVLKPLKDRKSKNTTNTYTLWLNNHPTWEQYPNRNVICSLSSHVAGKYGTTYIILPKNGTKIGVCPERDFWLSFNDIDGGVVDPSMLNYITNKIFTYIHVYENYKVDPSSYTKTIDAFKYIDDNLDNLLSQPEFSKIIDENFKNNGVLINTLYDKGITALYEMFYNPTAFEVVDTKNIPFGDNEVWFDNDFLILEDVTPVIIKGII